jgi:outer membrane protein assembly factor BamA
MQQPIPVARKKRGLAWRWTLAWVMACMLWLPSLGQASWPPKVALVEGIPEEEWPGLRRSLWRQADSLRARATLSEWMDDHRKAGRLEASVRLFAYQDDTLRLDVALGPSYHYQAIELEGLPPAYQEKEGLPQLVSQRAPVGWAELEGRLGAIVNAYQQEGYPFAAFSERKVTYQRAEAGVSVAVSYRFEAGPLSRLDTIRFSGGPREQPAFLYNLIRLRPGDLFQAQALADIPRILNNSIYYQQVETPTVRFTPEGNAEIDVALKKAKAGRFNVLLGLLPPQSEGERFQFTGNIDILLVSPLRQGELLLLKYDKLTTTSQRTELGLRLPYLLRTPLRVEGSFVLMKQAESFLNLDLEGGLEYAFSPNLAGRFFGRNRSTRLLDSALLDTSNLTPAQLDGSRQVLGVGFRYEKLDYRYNPSRGAMASFDLGLGRREIRRNLRLDSAVYAGIPLRQPLQEVTMHLGVFLPLWPRNVLYLANQTYWLGLQRYLRNDQWQVGGARSLRGFNENAFYTDFYSQATIEYRFQLEQDSYLFGFFDAAYLRDRVEGRTRYPLGTGIGMSYGTKAGILSIVYAVGRTEELRFQPARGRIHVGLLNRF